jgi:DNA polymerase III subunit chi
VAGSPQRVDFYVLAGEDARARLRFACRITEQAAWAGERVFVWLEDAAELERFDTLLWTFADRSFVPHEIFSDVQQWNDTPVLLGGGALPPQPYDLLLNLGIAVPADAGHAARIVEIIDADEARRAAGRLRFRAYRAAGLNPETHNVSAEDAS